MCFDFDSSGYGFTSLCKSINIILNMQTNSKKTVITIGLLWGKGLKI